MENEISLIDHFAYACTTSPSNAVGSQLSKHDALLNDFSYILVSAGLAIVGLYIEAFYFVYICSDEDWPKLKLELFMLIGTLN